ncbi:amino acid ABC transporter permease [Mesorhizobium sp. B2-4-19]|nr:amino acid ABC transporter permease [Mesorhizobium sp. B2-4-19]
MRVRLQDVRGTAVPAARQTPPLRTGWAVAIAAVLAAGSACAAFLAGANVGALVGQGTGLPGGVLAALCVLAVLAGLIGRAVSARVRSTEAWSAGRFVEARVEAAHARHHAFTAVGAGGFLLPCLAIVTFVTINDAVVYKTFLRGDVILASLLDVTKAFGVNVSIAVGAQVLSMLIGLLLAIGRSLQGSSFALVRAFCIAYVDIFRSLPAIVIIYLVCFGVPLMGIPVISDGQPMLYAIVALSLTYAAYNGEQIRAGLQGIHRSQVSAALSLGIPPSAVLRLIVLPQAMRRIAGPLLGNFIALQKDTALVNIVGIVDAFTQAKIYSANYYNLSSVTVVCILFIAITIPQTRLVDYLVARADSKEGR